MIFDFYIILLMYTKNAKRMLETIDLSTFKVLTNNILIKPDKNNDILLIYGPQGKKIELQLVSFGESEANHMSITGTVIKKSDNQFFFRDKGERNIGQKERASLVQASLQTDCDFPFNEGDKVYYNYNVHLSAEEEYRLFDTVEYGICMLIRLDNLFGYEQDGEVVPVNGYVFFERDTPDKLSGSGLIYIPESAQNHYGKNTGTVLAISAPVRAYMDGGITGDIRIGRGDKIVVDRRFGYKMAYDIHAGDVKNVEVILQKFVLAVLEEA